ncbi:hypothetical protein JCM10213_003486 [Rhodosporidiobolus nylandii]
MSVIYARKSDEKQFVFTKGAVERILDACANIQLADGPTQMDEPTKETILANVEALAEQGLRVLALAGKSWHGQSFSNSDGAERAEVEQDLTLYGLVRLESFISPARD